MAITADQAIPGTKVKIPTQKTAFGGGREELKDSLNRMYPNPGYLFITGEISDDTGENPYVPLWSSYPTSQGDFYSLQDLDLYQEDQEQSNPTSHPLPEVVSQGYNLLTTEDPQFEEGETQGEKIDEPFCIEGDPINPTHYNGKEVFNQMVALFGVEEVKVFCRLNAFKYLSRAGKKEGNPIDQEVKKALWYLKEYDNLNSLSNG